MGLASSVVYKFKCEQCSSCYIDDIRRHLWTRIRERVSGKPTSRLKLVNIFILLALTIFRSLAVYSVY